MEIRNATYRDWVALQGGMPSIETDKNGMTIITHDYPAGNGMQIRRHNPIDTFDTVRFPIGVDVVEFVSAYVRAVEGEPCETQSRKHGGDSYPRVQTR